MIKALAWALRQHPDKVNSLEKLVLVVLSDIANEEGVVNALKYKIARTSCLDIDELNLILMNLADKGFIKELENNTDSVDTTVLYKLIVI